MRRGCRIGAASQEGLKRNPHGGDLYVFRGRKGDLIKILWHDGIGLSLYAKRLDRGKFIWPSVVDGAVPSRPHRWAICLRRSTGGTLNTLSARKRWIDLWLTDERGATSV